MRVLSVPGVLVGALMCTPPAAAQAPWTGPGGGGLLGVQEAVVAEPTHGACGVMFDNYDRDPLGLDITDLRLSCRTGIVERLEFYASYQLSRGVVIPGNPPIPPPPMDIFIASGEVPEAPYRVMYIPMPYLTPGSTSVTSMRAGDYLLGLKALAYRGTGVWPAVAVSAHVSMTASDSLEDLRKGAGAGTTDVHGGIAATWQLGAVSPSLNVGFTHLGPLGYRDRFITLTGVEEPRTERPNLLHMGIGVRVRIFRRFDLIGQVMGWRPVGYHTPTLEYNGSSDALVGGELTLGRFTLTAGVRYHRGAPPAARVKLTGPLGNGVLLSGLPVPDRLRYLEAIGFHDPELRNRTGTLVIGTPDDVSLPAGATRIPTTFMTNTRGNVGSLIAVSFSF